MSAPLEHTPTTKVSTGSAGNLTIDKPAGAATGEILVATLQSDSPTTFTDPLGWNAIFDALDSGGGSKTHSVYRVVDGSEGANFQWSNTPSRNLAGIIYRISGQAAATPVTSSTDATQSTFTATKTSPSLTCPSSNCLVLWGGSLDVPRTINSVTGSLLAVAQDVVGGINNNSSSLLAVGNTADSGLNATTGMASWVLSAAATGVWLGFTIVIKPAVTSVGCVLRGRSVGAISRRGRRV